MLDKIKRAIARSRYAPIFLPDKRYGNLVPNINLDTARKQKKILLIYLDMIEAGIQISAAYQRGESGAVHTNRMELFQMVRGLIELDFCIDVCGNDDIQAKRYIEMNKYDIIIGMGELFRWTVGQKKAFSIIYMTENPYYISFRKEEERLDYFYQRHHRCYPFSRTGKFFFKDDEKLADAVICLGEKKYFENQEGPVERIYPSAFYNNNFDITKVARKNNVFLVFGTDGFIHKGIDLLVDIFLRHPKWKLYICGYHVTRTIKEIMKIDIRDTNIKDCGYIRVDSDDFLALANECRFILLPSCSEATSTAVLTGMRHGIIPVVTRGNGFDDMQKYCCYFEDFHIEAIEEKIEELCKIPENELDIRSQRIYEFSNNTFNESFFKYQFKRALQEIMKG